jgi:SAM-dependent methyltransferase
MTDLDYYGNDQRYFAHRAASRSDRVQSLRASLFSDLAAHTILDFGCGTGGVLSRLNANRKLGVEVGDEAAEAARRNGIEIYRSIDDVPAASVDIAISFHALEHVTDDLASLAGMYCALKPGGSVRLIVPGEIPLRAQRHWYDNPDKHLRTWTPLSFGNLAQAAGFTRIRTRIEPPPSNSRGVRLFGRAYRYYIGLRDNAFNVVLEAEKGAP